MPLSVPGMFSKYSSTKEYISFKSYPKPKNLSGLRAKEQKVYVKDSIVSAPIEDIFIVNPNPVRGGGAAQPPSCSFIVLT